MNKLGCCTSPESDISNLLNCKLCHIHYHSKCVFPQKDYKKLSFDFKQSWVCPDCDSKRRKQKPNYNNDRDNTPVRSNVALREDIGIAEIEDDNNVTTRKKLKQDSQSAPCTADDIRDIIKTEINVVRLELSTISTEIFSLRQEVQDMKSGMGFITEEFEKINNKILNVESKFKNFDKLATKIEQLSTATEKIENENNARDQWSRRSNIEICGIPEKKSENLLHIVEDLSKRAGFSIQPVDIDFVTRVASNSSISKPKSIIIRMQARYKKDDFLVSLKKLKLKCSDLGFSNNDSPIYFNDHLTKHNKVLLQRAKNLAKDNNYRYVWIKNCAIMIRKSDSSPVIHIQNEADLKKIK